MQDSSQISAIESPTDEIGWQNLVPNAEQRLVNFANPIEFDRSGNLLIPNWDDMYVGLNARRAPFRNVAIQNDTVNSTDYPEFRVFNAYYDEYFAEDVSEPTYDEVQDLANPFQNWIASVAAYPNSVTVRSDDLPQLGLEHQLSIFLRKLTRDALKEVFHDGMESRFGAVLTAMILRFGATAVLSVSEMLETTPINVEVTGELLRVLGNIEDHSTHDERLALLTDQLKSEDARTRDAASLGLAALEDPRAIPALESALQVETNPFVRPEFESAIEELREHE